MAGIEVCPQGSILKKRAAGGFFTLPGDPARSALASMRFEKKE
jgi:hypothetical protein